MQWHYMLLLHGGRCCVHVDVLTQPLLRWFIVLLVMAEWRMHHKLMDEVVIFDKI
jgi:hypothetical protein